MLANIFKNRLFIGALVFFVLCVGGGTLYMWHVEHEDAEYASEMQDSLNQWNTKQKEQPTAETPVVEQSEERQQDGDFHSDGTWHQGPRENRVQESLPTESASGPIPAVPPEAAVWEEKPDEQAPYHPHDDLSPEEHRRVHAELKQYGLKLDALIRLYEQNLADLQAGRITPEESQNFLDRTNPERDSLIANIKRLNGE